MIRQIVVHLTRPTLLGIFKKFPSKYLRFVQIFKSFSSENFAGIEVSFLNKLTEFFFKNFRASLRKLIEQILGEKVLSISWKETKF